MFIVVRYEKDYGIPHGEIYLTSIETLADDIKKIRKETTDYLLNHGYQVAFDIKAVGLSRLATHIAIGYGNG